MEEKAETKIGIHVGVIELRNIGTFQYRSKDWLKVDRSAHFTVTEWHDESHGEAVLRRLGEGGPR